MMTLNKTSMNGLLTGIFILLISCSKNGESQPAPQNDKPAVDEVPGYQLEWMDDFSTSSLDLTKWYHRYPGNRHDGFNDPDAVSIVDGNLQIKTYSDTVNSVVKHHTGMIATKKEFLYGRFEMRAAMVNQSGSWSAFWVQSATVGNPVGNPQQAGMEIDVVESLPKDGRVYHNLHWDSYGTDHKTTGFKTSDLGANSGNYHVYALEWSPTQYKFYVDGKLTWSYSANIAQRSEFIILSTEVRNDNPGSWAGAIPAGGYGSKKTSTTLMKVDYVKYYKAL